jgi:hypothetical protein
MGFQYWYTPPSLYLYRKHEGSKTFAKNHVEKRRLDFRVSGENISLLRPLAISSNINTAFHDKEIKIFYQIIVVSLYLFSPDKTYFVEE